MLTVKITKLQGETGLIQPGRLVNIPDATAKEWVAKGWAIEVKQEKQIIETKEKKFTKKEKQTKNK